MNTNVLLFIVALVILIGGGWLLFGDDMLGNGNTATTTPNGTPGDTTEVVSETYTSSEFDFSMQHATSAEVTVEAENHTKFLYAAPGHPAATELQDGYIVTVSAYPIDEYDSLDVFAQDRLNSAQAIDTILEPLAETAFHNAYAVSFTSEGLSGPVTHLLVESPAWYYEISYMVVGPDTSRYETIVDEMLASFTPEGGLVGEAEQPSIDDSETMDTVSIAFLDTEQETSGKERGCDRVVMVDERILPTTMPLTAALKTLFAIERQHVTTNQWYNFIAKTNDTLFFDRVTVQDGVAKVYLTGELSGLAGVCDDPRAQIQIEETALQFPTVNDVEIYLNGERTELTPDERG